MAKRPFRAMLALAAIMAAISLSPSCSRRTLSRSESASGSCRVEASQGEIVQSLAYTDLRTLATLLTSSVATDSVHVRTHAVTVTNSAGRIISHTLTEDTDRTTSRHHRSEGQQTSAGAEQTADTATLTRSDSRSVEAEARTDERRTTVRTPALPAWLLHSAVALLLVGLLAAMRRISRSKK